MSQERIKHAALKHIQATIDMSDAFEEAAIAIGESELPGEYFRCSICGATAYEDEDLEHEDGCLVPIIIELRKTAKEVGDEITSS